MAGDHAATGPADCAWCGEPLPNGDGHAWRVAVCAACGVGTTVPVPTEEDLASAYGDWYRPDDGRFSGPGDAVLSRLRSRLAGRIDSISPPGAVLDVGSGDGSLLRALAKRGRAATGIERSGAASNVVDAPLDAVEGEWACVVMWHSLEHLPEPGVAVSEAARLLAPGGVLIVAMPNFESLQARVFGSRWLALDLPRHLAHVPASSLIARLEDEGLRPQRVSHWRGGQAVFGWLHGLVGALPGSPDLYSAIRRPPARPAATGRATRAYALAAGAILFPVALVGAAAEVLLRRGGSIYVEAKRG